MAGHALSVWVGMVADKSPEVRAAGSANKVKAVFLKLKLNGD